MDCEFASRERSGEEDAELQRSTKKVKEDQAYGSQQVGQEEGAGARATLSYKASLVGDISGAYAQAFKVQVDNEEEPFSDDEIDDPPEGSVAIKLSKQTKINMRAKWTHSLIVKVFGRSVGFHFLHSRIMQLWKPAGRLDCIDLENEFFLIKFGLVEDYERVLKGGPWFVGEHFLTIRAWEPFFKPTMAACAKVAVWARLPGLPIELYEPEVLKEIGQAIGPVLRIDANTLSGTRGRYARLCVQVDLDAPLPRSVLIGRFKQDILYEGIGSLCFSCGRLGHRKNCCPYTVQKPSVEPDRAEEGEVGRKVDDVTKSTFSEDAEAGNERDDYGPWMLVGRRKFDSKSRALRFKSSTSNPDHISSFNAKDLGRPRRLSPEVTPPTCPPSFSPDGKRKLGGFNYSLASENWSASHVKMVPVAPTSELPKTIVCPSDLSRLEPISGHATPTSSLPKSDSFNSSPKMRNKAKPKISIAKVSHGEKSQNSVGNKSSRKNYAAVPLATAPGSSLSHHDLGVVRSGASSSMEQHLSVNSRESDTGLLAADGPGLARVGQPLVEIPNGHSVSSRREDSELEGTLAKFAGSSFARIKPIGGGSNKENLGGRTIGNKFSGVFGSHQDDSDMWELPTAKSSDQLKGAVVGSDGACDMHLEEQGGSEAFAEGAKLELAKSSKKSVSD